MAEDIEAGRLHLDAYVDTGTVTRGLQRRIDAQTAKIRARIKAEIQTRGLLAETKRATAAVEKQARIRVRMEINQAALNRQVQEACRLAEQHAVVRVKTKIEGGASVPEVGDQSATIEVNADTDPARTTTEAFRREQESRPVNIPVTANTTGLNQASVALMQLSKAPAIAGGVYILGTAVVSLGGGLVAMASAASQAVTTVAALPNLVGIAGQALTSLIIGASGIGDAVSAMGKEQAAAATTAQAMGRSQADAARQIADAERAIGDARRNAAEGARQAAEAIRDAEWNLARAQEAAKEAQEGLNEAREEAIERIQDLNRELRASVTDEEDAANAVLRAREELQDVRWDQSSSERERREAENALKQAQDDLAAAKDRREDLTKETKKANKEGVAGSEIMEQARDRARDTAHAAQEAEEDLANARRAAAQQAAAGARAVADAQRALADAQRGAGEAATAQTAAQTALADSMDNLSPAGQRFARFLFGLKGRWNELRFAIQEALLPPVQRGITAALPLLDTLQVGLVDTATRMGGLAERLGKLFGRETFNTDVAGIMASNNRALGSFNGAAFNLVQILRDLAVVAGPTLVEPFAKWVRVLTRGWRESINASRENGTLAARFERAADMARLLGDIVGNLGGAIKGMADAAAPSGRRLLEAFENTTAGWERFANSDEGQRKMREFFEATEPVTTALGDFIAQLTELIVKLSEGNSGPLQAFIGTLTTIVDGINRLLELPGAGPAIGWLFTLAGIGGALGIVSAIILRMARNIGRLGKLSGLSKLISGIRGSKEAIDDELPSDKKKTDALGALDAQGKKTGKSLGSRLVGGIKKATKAIGNGAKATARWGWSKFTTGAAAAGGALASAARATGVWIAAQARAAAATAAHLARIIATRVALIAQRIASLAAAAATRAMAIAQRLLNLAMMMNPIGLVVAAIIGLVAILVILYKRNETVRNAINRAWAAIKKAIVWAWQKAIRPAVRAMWSALQEVGKWATWLWKKAIVPAWRAIEKAVEVAWKNYYKPILKSIWSALETLGGWFKWLWDKGVKPAWDSIKEAIQRVWRNALKPTFEALEKIVKTTIPNAFRSAKSAIETIWNKLKKIASDPVEFMVNTVYTKGIRKMVNAIPGVPDLPEVSFTGWARGTSNVLPGYTPGKDVHRFWSPTAGGLDLSGGEAIMRPEWTRLVGPKVVNALNAAARRGKTALTNAMLGMNGKIADVGAYARGGIVGRYTRPFAAGGVFSDRQLMLATNFARSQVGDPYVWGGVGPNGFDCSGFMSAITNVLRGQYPFGRVGATGNFPWSGFKPGWGQFTIGSTPNYGGSGVGHMAGTLAGLNVESRGGQGVVIGPSARGAGDGGFSQVYHLGAKTAPGEGGGGGWFAKFKAAISAAKDFAKNIGGWVSRVTDTGGWGPMMAAMLRSGVSGVRNWVNDKIPGPGPIPSLFDTGGLLYPGATLAINRTGKTETVFTNDEMVDMSRHLAHIARSLTTTDGSGPGGAGPLVGGNLVLQGRPQEIPQLFSDAAYALRRMRMGGVHAGRTA